jgi:hypothetical protein
VLVANTKIALRDRISLLGGFAIPFNRLHIIIRHALASVVAVAQIALSVGIPFFRLGSLLLEQLACIHVARLASFQWLASAACSNGLSRVLLNAHQQLGKMRNFHLQIGVCWKYRTVSFPN